MSLRGIQALTFDTGGTILDWHTGLRTALAAAGVRHGVHKDWPALANEFRRRSLKRMLNHGEHAPATRNFDDVHRETLEQLLAENSLDMFTAEDRRSVWWDAIHNLQCWPDFPGTLPRLREKFFCVSFTILSFRIILDTARRNGLSWDAVISCEAIGKYKLLPEAYLTCARYLQLDPGQCCMIACHNFDLNAAKACGF
ncbi:MAG: HAD family hydrolase, partial [Betaproteobacteria bacterium]